MTENIERTGGPLYFSRTVCGRTDTGCGSGSQEADLCTG